QERDYAGLGVDHRHHHPYDRGRASAHWTCHWRSDCGGRIIGGPSSYAAVRLAGFSGRTCLCEYPSLGLACEITPDCCCRAEDCPCKPRSARRCRIRATEQLTAIPRRHVHAKNRPNRYISWGFFVVL